MPDDFIFDNLRLISQSLELINQRFANIAQPYAFVSTENGLLVLAAIAMRLQVIGELLKKIDKIDSSFLKAYTEINWYNIMRLRDIVSHHYEKMDHEIIYDICKNHLPELAQTVQRMLR